MDKQTLHNHIAVLRKLRDACSSQLDTGALTELDGVIKTLEAVVAHHQSTKEAEMRTRALQALAAFVSIATNFRDWL